jgi:hypothetical protein
VTNYNLLRCKLHVKFLVNGNPFFFGRLLAAYQPLHVSDTLTANAALVPQDNIQMSQMPRLFLDPTISQGGHMALPFFWYKDYIDVVEGDWDDMGLITVRTLTDLKHANGILGGTDVVTITAYAWAEDVQLAAPTHANSNGLSAQSGVEKDEYSGTEGMISKPAAVVAKAAGALSAIPILKPFALATQLAASAVSNIANIFGYSRPVIAKPPEPYRPQPVGDLCNTNLADNSKKLTVDVKQELSIDPRISGLSSTDELTIKYVASRESYWVNFPWNVGTAPETHLWNCRVDPCVWDFTSVGGNDTYFFPATAVASMPFKYWTGTLKYRFQIVASAMHRGRLAIVYDPLFTPSTREDNVNYIEIVDISECRDFTVAISNHQPTTYIQRATPSSQTEAELYSTSPLGGSQPWGNGTLSVWVLNELTTPNTDGIVDNDISINVFISAGDDFEVIVPDYTDVGDFVIQPQSGEERDVSSFFPQSGVDTTAVGNSESQPYKDQDAEFGTPSDNVNCRNLVYSGEAITSFRQMLKRYQYHTRRGDENLDYNYYEFDQCAFPFFRGNVAGAVHTASGPAPYNYCNSLLLHWVTVCYSGIRGGMRWKVIPEGNRQAFLNDQTAIIVTRQTDDTYNTARFAGASYTSESSVAYQGGLEIQDDGNGTCMTLAFINPAEEFEVPYYHQFRFNPGKQQNFTGGNQTFDGFKIRAKASSNGTTKEDAYSLWCAASEDFTCYFFTGMPRMYRETSFPTPA